MHNPIWLYIKKNYWFILKKIVYFYTHICTHFAPNIKKYDNEIKSGICKMHKKKWNS